MSRRRILLVAENLTLAQVVRLAKLGQSLPHERYEVHFACSGFDPMVFGESDFVRHELFTLPKDLVFRALSSGKRLYEKRTLLRYVEEELELLDRVRPDLVVGDFRLSLSTSAELRNVPCATLINAYWSPFAERAGWPVPDHPIVGLLGESMTEKYFPKALPRVFDHFAAPINALRKHHGLAPIGSLLEVLTHGDTTLYPDDPVLLPLRDAPSHHRFIGPVLWAPRVPMPELAGPSSAPLVYVTLGSSGNVDVLPLVVEALGALPLRVLVATAGRTELHALPRNVQVVPFVPGDRVCQLAELVISNGGSTTGYQALAAGVPVVGLPSNLDQYLTMQAFERAGVGVLVKARRADVVSITRAVEGVLGNHEYRTRAKEVAARMGRVDSGLVFEDFVAKASAQK